MTLHMVTRKFMLTAAALSVVKIAVVLAVVAARPQASAASQPPAAASGQVTRVPTRPEFFDARTFAAALEHAERSVPEAAVRGDVAAFVAPHHLLAAPLIAELFRTASGRAADTVYLVGPNHRDLGAERLATARLRWETMFGEVATADDRVAELAAGLGIGEFAVPYEAEHSVGALVPFVDHYFPGAKIVPVVVSSTATRQDVERLAVWLAAQVSDRSLMVFSIDFSHYLREEEAALRDAETRAYIERRDIAAILPLTSDHLDSPGSLAAALLLAEAEGFGTSISNHANANDFLANDTEATTSYFGVLFSEAVRVLR